MNTPYQTTLSIHHTVLEFDMNKYIIFAAILLLTAFSFQLSAQPGRSKNTTGKHLVTANELLAKSSYYNAITYIEQALVQDPGKITTIYLLADTYRKARDYDNAADYYGLLIGSKDPSVLLNYPLIRLHYADALKQSGEYSKAIDQYEIFAQSYTGKNANLFIRKAGIEKKGCEKALRENGPMPIISVRPLNSNVNSGYTDYAPMPIGDSLLLFSSIRSKQLISTEYNDYLRSKIYVAERVSTTRWQKARALKGVFANTKEHVGHGAYSPDGKRFYYTQCPSQENIQVKCKIYVSERKEGAWQRGKAIKEINIAGYKSSTPTTSVDSRGTERVYFTSDRPNGKGGLDIWYVSRNKDGSYTPAINFVGVNTPYDETTPHYDQKTNDFYFSSDGYQGYGGFDIYVLSTGERSKVENIGKTINSSADDMYFVKSASGKNSFMVSNRPSNYNKNINSSTCCDNIYVVTYGDIDPEPDVEIIDEDAIAVTGFVYATTDVSTKELENARLKIFDNARSSNPRLLDGKNSSVIDGFRFELEPNMEYLIEVSKDGFLKEKIEISTKGILRNKIYRKDVYLIQKGITMEGKVYSQDDKGSLLPYVGADITVFKKDINEGDQLIQQVNSTSEGYKVFLQSDGEYKVITNVDDYLTSSYEVSTKGIETSVQNKKDVILIPKKEGGTFKIDNIYYDTNSSALRPDSYTALNDLLWMLAENPTITIEIGAHTDSKGDKGYNQKLSLERAESVVNYLTASGVARDRLIAKGYGETIPIATNDSEENRQLNRRTEFKIIDLGN